LSRGATHAVCVEKSAKHAAILRQNLQTSRINPACLEARVLDAFTAIAQFAAGGRQFDLILADPPYGEKNVGYRSTSFAQRLLDDPHLPGLLTEAGLFILGHTKRDTLDLPATWAEVKFLKHGDTVMRFLRNA
ncbi:MAG: RsmD family RNA methyltransferase, partial [Pedosphaera parvula]|nr:RsmD family RNA methyltransferase [Pedosphaera parvula]